MKFTVNTKPLKSALAITIVDSNVSKYNQVSTLVQLTMSETKLTVNTEAVAIRSEVAISGSGDGKSSILIDALLFKKLISTINSTQLDIEFTSDAVVVRTASGSYSLPKLIDASDANLNRPTSLTQDEINNAVEVEKDSWKFVKSHQMYAIATTDEYPVYRYVFVGENGDVLVGDFTTSIFTHSTCKVLSENCLISESVVNLMNSVPDGAVIAKKNHCYVIYAKTDAFEYTSSFVPRHESDEFGKYNQDIIIGIMSTFDKEHVTVNAQDITNVLNQAQILNSKLTKITMTVNNDSITLSTDTMKSSIASEVRQNGTYTLTMNPNSLRNVISHCTDEKLEIYPSMNDNELMGIIIVSGKLSVAVAAGVED